MRFTESSPNLPALRGVSPDTMPIEAPAPQDAASTACPKGECPFVHGADPRCAEHLTVSGMSHAFDHCFDDFSACPLYHAKQHEARAQARLRHLDAPAGPRPETAVFPPPPSRLRRLGSRLVQLTVCRRSVAPRNAA